MLKTKVSLLTAASMLLLLCSLHLQAQIKGAVKISAVRAQLYYEDKNTFSKDILSDKNFSLWNTGAGEGSAEGPSNATLITIEVGGNDSSPDNLKLDVAISGKGGRVIQKKVFDVFIYKQDFKYYAALWVADTPCEPLKITARLLGKGATVTPVMKTIPFACGE